MYVGAGFRARRNRLAPGRLKPWYSSRLVACNPAARYRRMLSASVQALLVRMCRRQSMGGMMPAEKCREALPRSR